jgi:predicted acylesterase/phospholipase RssA
MEEEERKLGLALSGGGFRAAFFHVGVLARLAELRLLARVDIISTVSGGSIVGALYYLRLKKLLEREAPPTDEDYLEVVKNITSDLREPVQKNLRARVFLNPFKNFEMMARTAYSRSDRIGDLLDRMFYKNVWGDREKRLSGLVEKQIELRELPIAATPTPRRVPEFVMNATCLNTGHGWCFTPFGMGEPRVTSRDPFDRNTELAWGRFESVGDVPPITSAQRNFPLGLAVAASGGFPGLASPLPITGLYEGFRVRLMDGGAHDNQGVEALRNRACDALIVSDASGQLKDEEHPTGFLPFFLFRINNIYGDRVREEQLASIDWTENALMHLQEGLRRPILKPLGDDAQPIAASASPSPDPAPGMSEPAQRALARMRTDLDAFTDIETDSLMLDGYLISKDRLAPPRLGGFLPPPSQPLSHQWGFFRAEQSLANPSSAVTRKLHVGSKQMFKPFHSLPTLAQIILVLAAVGLAAYGIAAGWSWFGHVLHEARWWRILFAVIIPIGALPLVFARIVAAILGPRLISRHLANPTLAAVARWTPIIALVLVFCALIASAYLWGDPAGDWLGIHWSRWTSMVAAAAVFLTPALAPWLVSVYWLIEGKLYLWQGKLT